MTDEYMRALSRVTAAQVCEGLGFDALQRTAGDALSEVLLKFLSDASSIVHSTAEDAGRTEANVVDVYHALKELQIDMGDLMEYAGKAEEVPFPRPLPRIPLQRIPKMPPSWRSLGETPPTEVPAGLPSFPDPHTFKNTPAYVTKPSQTQASKLALHSHREAGTQALLALQERTQPLAPANYLLASQPPTSAAPAATGLHTNRGGSSETRQRWEELVHNIAAPGDGMQRPVSHLYLARAEMAQSSGVDSKPEEPISAMEALREFAAEEDDNLIPEASVSRTDEVALPESRSRVEFTFDFHPRARRVASIVRGYAASSPQKRTFQAIGGSGLSDEMKAKKAKAILSGEIGTVDDEDDAGL